MNLKVLFRHDKNILDEYFECSQIIPTFDSRIDCANSLVIARYSCLPFYKELEEDLNKLNSRLINTYQEHRYIANFEYYNDVEKYTFKTYFSFEELPENKSFVVKGRTNSRKHKWNSMMFAKDKRTAIEIGLALMDDALTNEQGIIIREYEELETFEYSINGLPITNEWRLFFLGDQLIDYGYYWSNIDDMRHIDNARQDVIENGLSFAKNIASIIKNKTNFFVVDIAKTRAGEWKLVELNDGQMSGLSMIDPKSFYLKLNNALMLSVEKTLSVY